MGWVLCVFPTSRGHADEAMVRTGTVRGLDKLGNEGADEAAEFGRRRFLGGLLMLGGIFLVFVLDGVLLSLYCIASLFLFLELLILLSGLLEVLPKGDELRCGIGLFYLDRLIFGLVLGSLLLSPPFSCRDIEVWPFSVGMLVKWVSFLSSLHWPADECNLCVGGVSFVELLIFV